MGRRHRDGRDVDDRWLAFDPPLIRIVFYFSLLRPHRNAMLFSPSFLSSSLLLFLFLFITELSTEHAQRNTLHTHGDDAIVFSSTIRFCSQLLSFDLYTKFFFLS